MNLFGDIICEELFLLSESMVSSDMVTNAMDNRERVIISYHSDDENENTGPRLIEIYAYGVTTAGNPVIRAFQTHGDTTTSIPDWKYFLLSRISSWKETGQTYDKLPEERYPGVGNFNPDDDKTMAMVYKIVSMDGGQTSKSPTDAIQTGPKTSADVSKSDNVFKTDAEKQIQSLRKQVEKPVMLKDLLPNKQNDNTQTKQDNGPKLKDTSKENNKDVANNTMTYDKLQQKLRNGEDLFKTDTERGLDKLQQQLKNPQKIDLSSIPKR